MRNSVFTFKSLTAKYLFVSTIFLLLLAGFISTGVFFTQYMKGDSRRINLAGRERMLVVKIASHMHFITGNLPSPDRHVHFKGAKNAMSEYQAALYGLRDGDRKLDIKPIDKHDKELISQLETLIALWENTQKPLLQSFFRNNLQNGEALCTSCHFAFRDNFPQLETFVKSLEMHSERELRNFDIFRIVFLSFFIVISISMVAFVKRYLIRPVKQLEKAASKIGAGNFDVNVRIESSDEIGMLGDTFNNMAQTLKSLFDEVTKKVLELRESEKHLMSIEKNLVNAQRIVHLGSWEWDIVNNRLYWSDEVYRIFGTEPQSFGATYQAFLSFVHNDDRELVEKAVNTSLSQNKPYSIEHRIILFDGSERIVHEQGEVTFDEAGVPVAMTGTVQDITERKLMEAKLKEYSYELEGKVRERTLEIETANRELEEAKYIAESANRAKSEFLANMSHELRTPLNAIMGFSEVILNNMAGPVSEDQREFLNDILESGQHLLSLINDILDLSKVEAGKMELNLSEVNIKELVEGSLFMIKEKIIKNLIHLQTDMQEDLGLIIADERKIKQVLFNLLSNAVKFTPNSGTITVRARKKQLAGVKGQEKQKGKEAMDTSLLDSGPMTHDPVLPAPGPLPLDPDRDFIEISVEDTGIGISSEDQEKLFQPFRQLETTLLKQYAGTGLGLNLSRKLIELHGGKIHIESEEGKGSRFIFILPTGQG